MQCRAVATDTVEYYYLWTTGIRIKTCQVDQKITGTLLNEMIFCVQLWVFGTEIWNNFPVKFVVQVQIRKQLQINYAWLNQLNFLLCMEELFLTIYHCRFLEIRQRYRIYTTVGNWRKRNEIITPKTRRVSMVLARYYRILSQN